MQRRSRTRPRCRSDTVLRTPPTTHPRYPRVEQCHLPGRQSRSLRQSTYVSVASFARSSARCSEDCAGLAGVVCGSRAVGKPRAASSAIMGSVRVMEFLSCLSAKLAFPPSRFYPLRRGFSGQKRRSSHGRVRFGPVRSAPHRTPANAITRQVAKSFRD